MSKVIENKFLRLELGSNGSLLSLKNLTTGTEMASPHGLWRLLCNFADNQEVELSADRSVCRIAVDSKHTKFKIEFRELIGSNGQKADVVVTILGMLVSDELRFKLSIVNNMVKDNVIRECHFPIISLSKEASAMDLYTSENGGRKISGLASSCPELFASAGQHQCHDYIYERYITSYPCGSSSSAAMNCIDLNSGSEGLYIGSHDPGFQTTCHIVEVEKPDKLNLAIAKLPFLSPGQTIFENYIVSAHCGSWHRGVDKYRTWAAEKLSDAAAREKKAAAFNSWQRIIMRSQYGENFFNFNHLEKLSGDGMQAGTDTLFISGWHTGGHENDYPNFTVSAALGGKEELKQCIGKIHASGGRVIMYANGRLIDHNSDFYRYGNGKNVSAKDILGNEHTVKYAYSGRGFFTAAFAGRKFSMVCPSSKEYLGIMKKFIDLAAEVEADGVFLDGMGGGDQLCCDSGHGHAVPFNSIIDARNAMLEKLRLYAANKELSLGIGFISDVTAGNADYVIPQYPGLPGSRSDFSFFRYAFPQVCVSARIAADAPDAGENLNFLLIQNLIADIEVYRNCRSIAQVPDFQARLTEVNAFRKKHAGLLDGAEYCSDALYSCDIPDLLSAGHLSDEDTLVIMATGSGDAKEFKGAFTVPGYTFRSGDIMGSGKIAKEGIFSLKSGSVVLLEYIRKQE